MKKEKYITRTIFSTKAAVLMLDVTTASVEQRVIEIAGKYETDAEVLAEVKKLYTTETVKPSHIVSFDTVETLYGITENDFIKYGKQLPPRKNYNTDN